MSLENETDGLRAELENAFKGDADQSLEAAAEIEANPAADGPARDDKGRFAAKVAAEPAEPDAESAQGAAQTEPAVTEEPAAATAGPSKAPPNTWSADAKAAWASLPPAVQDVVLKREADVNKLVGRRDEDAVFGRDLNRVIQPYLPIIRAQGGTPVEAISSLLNTAYILHTGTPQAKAAALQQVAQQYGVDLGQSFQPQDSGDPRYSQIESRLAALQSQLAEREQAQALALQQDVENDISAFAADPARPHFNAVKGRMAALIASGEATDLQDAYDQAVWSVPDVRSSMLAQQAAEQEAKRKAAETKRLEDARRKAVSVIGAPGLATANAQPSGDISLRDQLQAAFRSSQGAV